MLSGHGHTEVDLLLHRLGSDDVADRSDRGLGIAVLIIVTHLDLFLNGLIVGDGMMLLAALLNLLAIANDRPSLNIGRRYHRLVAQGRAICGCVLSMSSISILILVLVTKLRRPSFGAFDLLSHPSLGGYDISLHHLVDSIGTLVQTRQALQLSTDLVGGDGAASKVDQGSNVFEKVDALSQWLKLFSDVPRIFAACGFYLFSQSGALLGKSSELLRIHIIHIIHIILPSLLRTRRGHVGSVGR